MCHLLFKKKKKKKHIWKNWIFTNFFPGSQRVKDMTAKICFHKFLIHIVFIFKFDKEPEHNFKPKDFGFLSTKIVWYIIYIYIFIFFYIKQNGCKCRKLKYCYFKISPNSFWSYRTFPIPGSKFNDHQKNHRNNNFISVVN